MPSTLAEPLPVADLPMMERPLLVTVPPFEIVRVPLPASPTRILPELVQEEVAPLTVTVPVLPAPEPMVAL